MKNIMFKYRIIRFKFSNLRYISGFQSYFFIVLNKFGHIRSNDQNLTIQVLTKHVLFSNYDQMNQIQN